MAIYKEKPQFMQGLKQGPPPGYKPIKGNVSQNIGNFAKSLLDKDFGYERYFVMDGKKYFARLEPHYHEPPTQADYEKANKEGVSIRKIKQGPYGWHKGVTVYEAIDQNISEEHDQTHEHDNKEEQKDVPKFEFPKENKQKGRLLFLERYKRIFDSILEKIGL